MADLPDGWQIKSWRWLLNGAPIMEAILDEYKPQSKDVGGTLTARCRLTQIGYTDGVAESQPSTVHLGNGIECGVGVLGDNRVGSTLRAKVLVPPGWSVAYQWLRGGVPIAGARKRAYELVTQDAGRIVQVKAQWSRPGYVPGGASSTPTHVVSAASGGAPNSATSSRLRVVVDLILAVLFIGLAGLGAVAFFWGVDALSRVFPAEVSVFGKSVLVTLAGPYYPTNYSWVKWPVLIIPWTGVLVCAAAMGIGVQTVFDEDAYDPRFSVGWNAKRKIRWILQIEIAAFRSLLPWLASYIAVPAAMGVFGWNDNVYLWWMTALFLGGVAVWSAIVFVRRAWRARELNIFVGHILPAVKTVLLSIAEIVVISLLCLGGLWVSSWQNDASTTSGGNDTPVGLTGVGLQSGQCLSMSALDARNDRTSLADLVTTVVSCDDETSRLRVLDVLSYDVEAKPSHRGNLSWYQFYGLTDQANLIATVVFESVPHVSDCFYGYRSTVDGADQGKLTYLGQSSQCVAPVPTWWSPASSAQAWGVDESQVVGTTNTITLLIPGNSSACPTVNSSRYVAVKTDGSEITLCVVSKTLE